MFHRDSFRLASRAALVSGFLTFVVSPAAATDQNEVREYLKSAKSASYRDNDPVIVLDAESRTFLAPPPSTLKRGDRLWVALVNVDTVRFVYKIQGTLVSYQPSQVPSPLSSIVLLAPPKAVPAPPPEAGARATIGHARDQQPVPEHSRQFRNVLLAFDGFRDEALAGLDLLRREAALDDGLRPLALEQLTNEQRRARAAEVVRSWYGSCRADLPEPLDGDPWCIQVPSACAARAAWVDLGKPVIPSGAAKKLQEFAGTFAALLPARQRAIEDAYLEFVEATFAWKAYFANVPKPNDEPAKTENDVVTRLGEAATDFHERIGKTLPAFQDRFTNAAKLLALIMDGAPEGRTPGVLVRSFSDLTFDEFQLSLGVQPAVPLAAPAADASPAVDPIVSSLPIPVIGCCRIGFSLGLVGTSLVSKHWYLAPNADATKKTVAEGPKDSADLSPAALVHFDRYFSPRFAAGLAVGLTTSSPVRTLFGASASLGRRVRGTLTAGLAVGSVPDLNGDVVGAPPINDGSVTTTNVMRAGWFLGLSGSFAIP